MNCRPYRLLATRTVAEFKSACMPVMLEWWHDWFRETSPSAKEGLTLLDRGCPRRIRNLRWQLARQDDSCVYVGAAPVDMGRLAHSLLPNQATKPKKPHPLLACLLDDAIKDLAQRLIGVKSVSDSIELRTLESIPVDDLLASGSGSACFTFKVGSATLYCWLNGEHMSRFQLPHDRNPQPLNRRQDSIQTQSVRLVVELDLGEIPVTGVSTLRPGDVITTGISLSRAMTVVVPGRGRIASGHLGQSRDKRALILHQ